MCQQFHNRTARQRAKRARLTKSTPSFGTLARQYFDLQRLRQQVRIAECGKLAGQELSRSPVNYGAAAEWSPLGARRSEYSVVQH